VIVETLAIGALVALGVAIGAIVTAFRAGRKARIAAELVATLLEPDVAAPRAATLTASEPSAAKVPEQSSAPLPSRRATPPVAGQVHDAPIERSDSSTRIPVLDLDRLRIWLTGSNLEFGRLAIVSVELDNLEHVQERLGVRAGAHLLEAITQRLRTVTRPRDVVAHIGQDRFVLVCRDVPDLSAAEAVGERVAMGVAHPSVLVTGVAEVTASIGVALAHDADEPPEATLRRAIEAGTRARESGGGRIELSPAAPTAALLADELPAALHHHELRLHYLPIVSAATGRVAGFETLLRWEHPERGLLRPAEFLPLAERSGAIVPIGRWAIEEACRQVAVWHEHSGSVLKLNINLSTRQFTEPTLSADLERIVADAGLAPGVLWLEITEATLLHDRETSARTLDQLHDLGVQLVIDDFGTGASSLASLKHFPLDAIKIDGAFVADLGRNRDSDAICGAIVDLAHSLGLCAIAEGVERLEQFAVLRALGCELAQGHLFGPARPANAYGDAPPLSLGLVRGLDPG
jgi:diguanylate cyclase (GGDEF)-like protein